MKNIPTVYKSLRRCSYSKICWRPRSLVLFQGKERTSPQMLEKRGLTPDLLGDFILRCKHAGSDSSMPCGSHGERGFCHSNCSPQTDSLSPKHPHVQTPPATAGNERPVQMKPQMLWISIFPSIHAVLLQNLQVKCCQNLLSCFLLLFLFLNLSLK